MLYGELLFWCKEWCAAMADKITDFVYADDSKETIDVINVLLLGWILLGLVVYVLGNVIAAHWRRKKGADLPAKRTTRTPPSADGPLAPAAVAEEEPCAAAAPPEAEGERDEPLVVVEGGELGEWVSAVLGWVRRERVVSPLADAWRDALNASARIAAAEHGLLVEFRDLLPTSRPPKVRAIRGVDGEQAVECDVDLRDASFELGVCPSGEGGRRLPLLPYVLQLHTLTGKVWVECVPRDVSFVARFLEPPAMELSVEPSNDIQDEDHLCDDVQGVCRDALGGSCVRLRLACFPECPRLTPTVEDERGEGRELLVTVVRAGNLGEGVLRPFCVLEVDDPPQRHSTRPGQGREPLFDAHFPPISVKDSAELLFEVYDQEKANSGGGELLGLCMVEVGELLCHPRQRQVVPLTPMGHRDPPSDATLTLEFVFPDVRRVETNSRVTAQGTLITTTTIQRTDQDGEDQCVAGRALAQLGSSPSGTSRSTLIIHSVHRPECSSPESPRSEPLSPHAAAAAAEEERGGRKGGGVLGALRRRLSLRSRSSERSSNPASPRRTLASSARSSLSEVSSAATFVHENSTLVVETNENGIMRRYLVPGGHPKKKPRGAKLHIFNDHVFVARHLPGSVPCGVCGRHLTRRPGKQGYECRGCGVRCHKRCHVRVEDFCPNSSVSAMEVEYLQQGASPKSI